jgi:hypothetical protein
MVDYRYCRSKSKNLLAMDGYYQWYALPIVSIDSISIDLSSIADFAQLCNMVKKMVPEARRVIPVAQRVIQSVHFSDAVH